MSVYRLCIGGPLHGTYHELGDEHEFWYACPTVRLLSDAPPEPAAVLRPERYVARTLLLRGERLAVRTRCYVHESECELSEREAAVRWFDARAVAEEHDRVPMPR